MDNLATACRKCNGGKGARSLSDVPASSEVIARLKSQTATLKQQANAIKELIAARDDLGKQIAAIKGAAYATNDVEMQPHEISRATTILREFGVDSLVEFYNSAASNGVSQWWAVKYISGCVRKRRQAIKDARILQHWDGNGG